MIAERQVVCNRYIQRSGVSVARRPRSPQQQWVDITAKETQQWQKGKEKRANRATEDDQTSRATEQRGKEDTVVRTDSQQPTGQNNEHVQRKTKTSDTSENAMEQLEKNQVRDRRRHGGRRGVNCTQAHKRE